MTSDLVRRLTALGAVMAGASAAMSFVNAVTMRRLERPRSVVPGNVVVCIPARNEEDRLPRLLHDLTAQTLCTHLRVVVLDDGSTDETFLAAERVVADDPRFEVVRTELDPPDGWTGKAAACHTLAQLALEHPAPDCPAPEYIAFVDADVRLDSRAVSSTVASLRSSDASLLCPWPRQLSGSLAEALVQPLLAFSWMSTLPVRISASSTRPSTVVACGQFMMFEVDAYRSIGGHASVAASLTEDLDIARELRRQGMRTDLVAGGEFVRCRMYDGWPALRDGYTRWLWNAFGGRLGSASVLAAIAVMYLVPPAAAAFGSGRTRQWGLFGYLAAVASRSASALAESTNTTATLRPEPLLENESPKKKVSVLTTVAVSGAHPLSVLIYGGLTVESFRRRHRRSSTWKGRSLPGRA